MADRRPRPAAVDVVRAGPGRSAAGRAPGSRSCASSREARPRHRARTRAGRRLPRRDRARGAARSASRAGCATCSTAASRSRPRAADAVDRSSHGCGAGLRLARVTGVATSGRFATRSVGAREAIRRIRRSWPRMTEQSTGVIQSVSREARRFPPPRIHGARADQRRRRRTRSMYRRSIDDPEGFWAETARAELTWIEAVHEGARLEAAVREVVRRRRAQPLGELPRPAPRDRAATRRRSIWEGEPGDSAQLTYARAARARSASSPTRSRRSAWRPAIASPSTCR